MVLGEVEEELVLESGLCSDSLSGFLPNAESVHDFGCCARVIALSERSEFAR